MDISKIAERMVSPYAKSYDDYQGDIAKKIRMLQSQLKEHARKHKSDPENRAFNGDLSHVVTQLNDLVAFMG